MTGRGDELATPASTPVNCSRWKLVARQMSVGDGANIINAVPLASLKDRDGCAPTAARIPVDPALVAPGALGTEGRRADIRRIVIVKIGIAGQAKRAADTGANFQSRRDPITRSEGRTQFVIERSIDLIAHAERETETAEGPHIKCNVWSASGPIVHAQIVAVDAITVNSAP